jgi:hypothetical protein
MLYKRVTKEIGPEFVYPPSCPLAVENDKLLPQEKAKKRRYKGRQDGEYECTFCGKKFKNEHYIDMHMERAHPDVAVGRTCFAEYCRVFGACEKKLPRASKNKTCDVNASAAARDLCEDMVRSCFPISGPGRQLGSELRRSLCGMLDCTAKQWQEHDNKHHSNLELVVVVIVFLFVIIVGMLILLVFFENGDDLVEWLLGLQLAGWFGELVRSFGKTVLRSRSKVQKEVGYKKVRSI